MGDPTSSPNSRPAPVPVPVAGGNTRFQPDQEWNSRQSLQLTIDCFIHRRTPAEPIGGIRSALRLRPSRNLEAFAFGRVLSFGDGAVPEPGVVPGSRREIRPRPGRGAAFAVSPRAVRFEPGVPRRGGRIQTGYRGVDSCMIREYLTIARTVSSASPGEEVHGVSRCHNGPRRSGWRPG